jgi:DNA-binding NtrC family response regulator
VVREIERNMQRAAAQPAQAASPHYVMAVAGPPQGPGTAQALPIGMMMPGPVPAAPAGTAAAVAPPPAEAPVAVEEPPPNGPISLSEVARAAAVAAERIAIERTLKQVHWNRRKAAQLLGVSYKTLLNKIKECGISRR